ncbi:MAG: hypothetical protein QM702_00085 [Rubrivivax sp.]
MSDAHDHLRPPQQARTSRRPSLGFVVVVAAIALVVGGNYHFLHGSETGFVVLSKKSFSLSEVVVNTDELANMPMIMARSKYPMTLAALSDKAIARGAEADLSKAKMLQPGADRQEVLQLLGRPTEETSAREFRGLHEYEMIYRSQLQGRYIVIELQNHKVSRVRD